MEPGRPLMPVSSASVPMPVPVPVPVGTRLHTTDDGVPREEIKRALDHFWEQQMKEAASLDDMDINPDAKDGQIFKNHNDLPLARIKRIMKSDEDVRMIRAETPVLFAKACEMFILELTIRAWCFSERNKRRNLHKEDVQAAVQHTETFDFLVDVINAGGIVSTAGIPDSPTN